MGAAIDQKIDMFSAMVYRVKPPQKPDFMTEPMALIGTDIGDDQPGGNGEPQRQSMYAVMKARGQDLLHQRCQHTSGTLINAAGTRLLRK